MSVKGPRRFIFEIERILGMVLALSLMFQSLITPCNGYGLGAPPRACAHMTPGHSGISAQNSKAPYQIRASQDIDGVKVALYADPGEHFKGFLIKPFIDDGKPVPGGIFTRTDNDTRTYQCGNEQGVAITHSNSKPRQQMEAVWQPPSSFKGNVFFRATVVKEYDKFWKDVESNRLEIFGKLNTDHEFPASPAFADTGISGRGGGNKQVGSSGRSLKELFDACGETRGCFEISPGCIKNRNCESLVTYAASDEAVHFQIARKLSSDSDGYVAIGFSDDDKMGNDFVTECVHNGRDTPVVHQSWNFGRSNSLLGNNFGVEIIHTQYADGLLFCEWKQTQNVSVEVRNEIRNFTLGVPKLYHLLLAIGPLKGSALAIHDAKIQSREPIDFTEFTVATGSRSYLVQIHGSLMVVAWIGTVSIGILLARHYKHVWEANMLCATKVWFACHRGLMFLSVALTIGAFVIIFLHVDGWSQKDNPHPVLGVITTVLAVMQPIMALFRPHPTSPKRPIFNWLHWFVGNAAHILAITTIFFAMELLPTANPPKAFLWILVAFVAFHCIIHIIMQLHAWIMEKKRSNEIGMKDFAARDAIQEPEKDAPGSGFRRFILGIYIVVDISLMVALILIICFAK